MAQPTPYDPSYSFTSWQVANPRSLLPGGQLDVQFNAIQDCVEEIITNLALIQRDDGALANEVVTYDSLAPELRGIFSGAEQGSVVIPSGDSFATNVKTFGAKGDGATDDTASIQAAINSPSPFLYFPAGTYICGPLTLRSNQVWFGEGMYRSIISRPQVNDPTPQLKRGLTSTGDISNWVMQDMGLRGNVEAQTTPDLSGQSLWGIWMRAGSIENVVLRRCRIYNWGAQGGNTGGAAAFATASGSNKVMENIYVEGCQIEDNANVPGVYIAYNDTWVARARSIKVCGNKFINRRPDSDQNMIFYVGTANCIADQIAADDNTFEITDIVDVAIEINYARNFTVNNNRIMMYENGRCDGILLRSSMFDGSVCDNVMTDISTRITDIGTGITLLRQQPGETQERITIAGNVITDFRQAGITLSNQSRDVTVVGNVIAGSLYRPNYGFRAAGSQNVVVADNVFRKLSVPIEVASGDGGTSYISVRDNLLVECGSANNSLIAPPVIAQDVTYVTVEGNTVRSPVTGVTALITPAFLSSAGNIVRNNILPEGFREINPSFAQYIESVQSPTRNSGTMAITREYTFIQGQIALIPYTASIDWNNPAVQKSAAVIGGNLDNVFPICEPGDSVAVGCSSDLDGAVVSGYVASFGKIRITVQNPKSINLTIPPSRWWVTVTQRQPYSRLGTKLRVGTFESGTSEENGDGRFTINGEDVTIAGNNSISLV